jgi:hypothetical protein
MGVYVGLRQSVCVRCRWLWVALCIVGRQVALDGTLHHAMPIVNARGPSHFDAVRAETTREFHAHAEDTWAKLRRACVARFWPMVMLLLPPPSLLLPPSPPPLLRML